MKRTLLLLLFSYAAWGQPFKETTICDKLIKTDSIEYKSKSVKGKTFPKTNSYKKTKGVIKVQTKEKVLAYKDTDGIDGYEYNVRGADTIKKWVLVERSDIQQSIYFLINLMTLKIDTLIGEPRIYDDKIICKESIYTDSPNRIEIWKIKDNNIVPLIRFSLSVCEKYGIGKFYYLKQKTLYLLDDFSKDCWKIDLMELR
jgi:hypothetical protein